jgi:hypothetical protein
VFIWFAIISMNVLFAIAAIVYWIPCTPVEKVWHPFTPGTCVDQQYGLTVGIVASSESAHSGTKARIIADSWQYTPALWI